jgi:transcriptional regulator with XRE-family HTH domain
VGLAPPPSTARRSELADFLRDRRARVTPESVGLPGDGRRRTPGLRREEVAQLAGVGLSWYTWLEQGRDIRPSAQVLDALARVLRLGTAEHAHLFHLARVELPLPGGDYPREAPPELAAIVEGLLPNPAYLIGPRTDVLAWNRAATADRTCSGGCSPPTSRAASSGAPRAAPPWPAFAPSTPAASATRTSPRSSRRSRRPAPTSAPGGRATRS